MDSPVFSLFVNWLLITRYSVPKLPKAKIHAWLKVTLKMKPLIHKYLFYNIKSSNTDAKHKQIFSKKNDSNFSRCPPQGNSRHPASLWCSTHVRHVLTSIHVLITSLYPTPAFMTTTEDFDGWVPSMKLTSFWYVGFVEIFSGIQERADWFSFPVIQPQGKIHDPVDKIARKRLVIKLVSSKT